MYQFLTVDVKAYLPPLENVTTYFLKGKLFCLVLTVVLDLIEGKKKFLPTDRVVHIAVPA